MSTDVYVTNCGGGTCIRYFLMVKCSFFAIKIQRKVKITKSIKISVDYAFLATGISVNLLTSF